MNYTVCERPAQTPYKPSSEAWAFDASCRAFVKELAFRMPYLEMAFIHNYGIDLGGKYEDPVSWQYSAYFDIRRIGGPERLSTNDSVRVDGTPCFLPRQRQDHEIPAPWN